MKLDDLRLARRVADLGSLAAVARVEGTDPSAVSRRLAQVERALGFRVFQRTTRRLSPTAAGRAWLDAVGEGLAIVDDAAERGRAETTRVAGTLRMTASVAFGQEIVVPALAGFRARYPAVSVELVLTDAPLDLVAEGLDLALRLGPRPTGGGVSRKLAATRYRVCASPGWLAANGRPETPKDLARVEGVRLTLPGFPESWRFRDPATGREVELPVRGPFAVSTVLALRAAARTGLGPALLTDWLTEDDRRTGRLVDLLPGWQAAGADFETSIWAIHPGRRHQPRRTRAMIDHLAKRLSHAARTA